MNTQLEKDEIYFENDACKLDWKEAGMPVSDGVFVVVAITILLSMSVLQMIVAEMVPATSLAVPLIGRCHSFIHSFILYRSFTGLGV